MRLKYLLFVPMIILMITACGSGSAPDPAPVVEEVATEEVVQEAVAEAEELMTTESGLQYIVLEEGSGEQPQPGDTVLVHYAGTLEDGTEFDNSFKRGEPIAFTLGQGEVIPGWDEGIALLNEGSKARLVIPPELGYGAQGAGGGVIPPNATLIFEVELVEVQ